MKYPSITANLAKIQENAQCLSQLCHAHGIRMAAVTKCVCADARIAEAMERGGADMLADSRTENLLSLHTELPKLLLRLSMPDRAEETVRASDVSLESDVVTIERLGIAAEKAQKRHRVILMLDLGDLREGILFSETREIERAAEAVLRQSALELYGVGTNLTCYGGILPDETNLGTLVRVADALRRRFDAPIPVISGGNSSSIGLLKHGGMPAGVNHLRLGESILLGMDTAALTPFPGLHTDAFTLEAELIEVQKKPSLPIGTSGANAFGERVQYRDEGEQLRGILAIGRQDAQPDGLIPRDFNVRVLGASSDHLIVDLTCAKTAYRTGDTLSFSVNYGALLAAYTSPYIEKRYQ